MNPEFWYVHLPNFLLQSLLVIWFLRPMEVVGTVGFGRRILSYVSFLLLLPLFMSTQFNLTYNIWSTTLRFFYRAVVYVVYLRLRKNSPYLGHRREQELRCTGLRLRLLLYDGWYHRRGDLPVSQVRQHLVRCDPLRHLCGLLHLGQHDLSGIIQQRASRPNRVAGPEARYI